MKKLKLCFIIICLTIQQSSCWEWDPLNIHKNIDREKAVINEAIDKFLAGSGQLIIQAKTAVEEIMDKLFDEKLAKMFYQIQSMIDKNLKQINTAIQETIDKIFKKIDEMVDNMCKKALELINETIDQIKTKIIDEFFHKADILVADITADVIKILNQIDEGIFHAYCSEKALADQLINAVAKVLPSIPNPK
jgi:hypothetical protein